MKLSKIALFGIAAVFALSVAACDNTIRGAGRDIQDTGDAVQDAAR
jgi:Predicted small secreted protein